MDIFTCDVKSQETFSSIQEDISSLEGKEYEVVVRNLGFNDQAPFEIFPTTCIYDIIVQFLSDIRDVLKIFILREENTFCIWTVCSKDDKSVRYRIFEGELEIIKIFSTTEFHFDLYLADIEDIKELVNSGAKLIYSKR